MIGDDSDGLGKLLSLYPGDEQDLIGTVVAEFVKHQDPDDVEFKAYPNGWEIKVYTDRDKSEEALEFWKENVEPQLTGE